MNEEKLLRKTFDYKNDIKPDTKFIRSLLNKYQEEVRFTILHSSDNKGQQVNHLQRKFRELKENISMAGLSV